MAVIFVEIKKFLWAQRFAWMCVCAQHTARCPWRPNEGVGWPGTEVIVSRYCKPMWGSWELNPGCLKVQPVLTTVNTSQPQNHVSSPVKFCCFFGDFFLFFPLFLRKSHSIGLAVLEQTVDQASFELTCINLAQVLRLKAQATMPGFVIGFFKAKVGLTYW